MYKLMITTLDSGDEGFSIEENFVTESGAWWMWDRISDEYPEMTGVWVELQTIVDEFGAEAAANINSSDGEEQWNDYFLDNGTHL